MSFFENLGQKINDVGQTTIKKTKNLADTAKLNLTISEEERKITSTYEQIGKWYVRTHKDNADADVAPLLHVITTSEAKIKECKENIHQMKGRIICPACGASVDADAAFCSACGQKLPEAPQPEPVKDEDVEIIPPEQPTEPASEEKETPAPEETPEAAGEPTATATPETPVSETSAEEVKTAASEEAADDTFPV